MGITYLKNTVNVVSANAQNSNNPLKVSSCWHVYGDINSGLTFSPRLNTQSSLHTASHSCAHLQRTDWKQGGAQVETGQARIVSPSLNLLWWLMAVSVMSCVTRSSIRCDKNVNTIFSKQVSFQYSHEFLTRNEQQENKLIFIKILWDFVKFGCQTVVIFCIYVFMCLPYKCIHFSLYI